MRNKLWSVLLAALALGGVLAPRTAAAKLNVVATLTDLGSIAESVGGEDVQVTVLCPGTRDPHHLPAKPSLARRMSKADMLVYAGLELEIGWLPQLIEKARNPRVRPGAPGDVDCSRAIDRILEIPPATVDRSEGDLHPMGNPHYTLDPRNAVAIARLLADRMAELDPAHADAYRRRAEAFVATIEGNLPRWRQETEKLRAHHVLIYHKHWSYLVDWLGLAKVGEIENRPGIAPSPRHVHDMIEKSRRLGDVVVICATWDDVDQVREIARRIGAPLAVLPGHTGGVPGADTYVHFIDTLCRRLAEATAGLPE